MRFLLPFLVGFLFVACGSLERSRLDRELRIQGVYLCAAQAIPRPKGESVDTAVPRCSQDSVAISEDHITWSRRFFVDAECQVRAIGSVEWVTSAALEVHGQAATQTRLRSGAIQSRQLFRADYNWFLDQKAGCDLRRLPVNEAVAIGASGNCAGLFPPSVQQDLLLTSAGRGGASRLELPAKRICER